MHLIRGSTYTKYTREEYDILYKILLSDSVSKDLANLILRTIDSTSSRSYVELQYPFDELPLHITDAMCIPIVLWRLKIGR